MLRLIRYNDGMSIHDLWYWVNENDIIGSPIFESESDAMDWMNRELH